MHTNDTAVAIIKDMVGVINEKIAGDVLWEKDGNTYSISSLLAFAEDIVEHGFSADGNNEGELSSALNELIKNGDGSVKIDVDRGTTYAEVSGTWTGHISRNFSGDSILDAIKNAMKKKEAVELKVAMLESAGTQSELEREINSPVDGAVDRGQKQAPEEPVGLVAETEDPAAESKAPSNPSEIFDGGLKGDLPGQQEIEFIEALGE